MLIQMKEFGENKILSGALSGKKALSGLLEKIIVEPDEPESVFLDFDGIEVATASFLRESILEFRNSVRRRRSNYYPVVANANNSILEEFLILLKPKRDVLMLCSLEGSKNVSSSRLIGDLEPKQRITFDLIQQLGEADVRKLMEVSPETQETKPNAWNNRLTSLVKLGVVVELTHGRTKSYRPLFLEN